MCYSDDARPPAVPGATGSVSISQDLTLTAADGNAFMAYSARASAPSGTGIVILPDIRGLHQFYKDLADRCAEAGFDTVAFDYFGRTAGHGDRDETFVWKPHIDATTPDGIAADVSACIDYITSEAGGSVQRVFTIGFCFGGSGSWRQSAAQPGLAGAIGFYGQPGRARDVIDRMKAPLLLLAAGEDFIPVPEVEQFDAELTAAGVPHTLVIYEGAPHSFFDRTFHEHAAACEDAWRQILAFIDAPPEKQ